MSIIDLKFNDRFIDPILLGEKTTTLRRRPKGEVGDCFFVSGGAPHHGKWYVIKSIDRCDDLLSVLSLWEEEGFHSAGNMLDWMEVNDYSPPLYLHRFEQYFIDCFVRYFGTLYNMSATPYELIANSPLVSGYEGLYRLEDGNVLECHEWIDQSWDDDEEEPFGAIYYDVFKSSPDAPLEPEPIDGGVLGYSESDTLMTFNNWLLSCNQSSILAKIGSPAVPCDHAEDNRRSA